MPISIEHNSDLVPITGGSYARQVIPVDVNGNVISGGGSGGSVTLLAGNEIVGKVGIDQTAGQNVVVAASASPEVVTLGAKADAPATTTTTDPWSVIAILKGILAALKGTLGLSAGSNVIGKVGIDQTTPGTTNAVVVTGGNSAAGAADLAVGQVTAGVAATLVVARPTRRSVLIRNLDTTLSVYIGPATVTAGNGMVLKAGESLAVTWVGLIQVLAASGSPAVAYWDEYD